MKSVELVTVNQCSGNSRGFVSPRVAGGQLGNGAMGNARWSGITLNSVLDMAGIQTGAKQVVFGGMDGPVSDKTPDFAKALDIEHARDGQVARGHLKTGELFILCFSDRFYSTLRLIRYVPTGIAP